MEAAILLDGCTAHCPAQHMLSISIMPTDVSQLRLNVSMHGPMVTAD